MLWLWWTVLQMALHNNLPQATGSPEGACLSSIVATSFIWRHYLIQALKSERATFIFFKIMFINYSYKLLGA